MAGKYVFYASANEYASQEIGLDITLNNVSKVSLAGYMFSAAQQTGTNMVVLTFQRGDGVWVKHAFGKGYWTQNIPVTTFTAESKAMN